jgi:hypothetical protein
MRHKDVYGGLMVLRACREALECTVDGVTFALSHADLPPDQWEPSGILGDYDPRQSVPALVFPWTPGHAREFLLSAANAIEVRPGDKLVIGDVKKLAVRAEHGELDHPEHREQRWAEVRILRANGKAATATTRWCFTGAADVMTPINQGDYSQVKEALSERLARATGIDDLDDLDTADKAEKAVWMAKVATAPPLYQKAMQALWECRDEWDNGPAMAFGYLLARAEAQELMLPLAKRRLEVGVQLRQNASKPRAEGDDTRRLALEVIAANPTIVRRKCAEKVATKKGLSDVRSVERTLGPLFTKGEDGRYRPDGKIVAAQRARLGMP